MLLPVIAAFRSLDLKGLRMLDPICPTNFDPTRLQAQADHFRALAAGIDDAAAQSRLLERASLLDQLATNATGDNGTPTSA